MRDRSIATALMLGLAVVLLFVAGSLGNWAAASVTSPTSFTVPVPTEAILSEPIETLPPISDLEIPSVPLLDVPTIGSPLATGTSATEVSVQPTANAPASPLSRPRPHRSGAVPILMYHYIRVNPDPADSAGFNLSVTPDDFSRQMRLLAAHGFTPVTVAEIRSYVRNQIPLPVNPVAITFDDGYADAYLAALPILNRNNMIATFYIVTAFVDRPAYVSWDQVTALDRGGMEIASHTVHHFALTVLGPIQKQAELANSRLELERHLGHDVLDFCYPGGQVDGAAEASVARAGYLSATTTAYGRVEVGDDPLRLARVRVWGGENLATFAARVGVTASPADSAKS